jgi:hypothetical protein
LLHSLEEGACRLPGCRDVTEYTIDLTKLQHEGKRRTKEELARGL